MNHFLPYKIDVDSEENFYRQLECFSNEIFESGKNRLNHEISLCLDNSQISIHEVKSTLLELLIIGVLWECHIGNANATRGSSLAELEYFKRLSDISTSTDVFKRIYYKMRGDSLLHDSENNYGQIETDEKLYRKLMEWLKATGEYKYELQVFEKWLLKFQSTDKSVAENALLRITHFAKTFIELGEKYLGTIINPVFFNVISKSIPTDREDYFQVTKPEPEYYLNMLAASWLNEINDNNFQSFSSKKIIVPGCMRPDNGKKCKAENDGAYLRCTSCNIDCNIQKITTEAGILGFDVSIALHQSTFKAETGQLKNSAVIGVACAGCLISGGLMLKQKGILAKCLVLNKPGCNKHWSDIGEITDISYSQIQRLLPAYFPMACTKSDS